MSSNVALFIVTLMPCFKKEFGYTAFCKINKTYIGEIVEQQQGRIGEVPFARAI